MNVANCPRCGKVFMKNVKNLCPDCIREDDQMYELVYRYLRDNPRATVTGVAEATGVPEDRVLAFLREGRILASEWAKLEYPCERCGAMINSGRYCERCAREVQNSLQMLASQISTPSTRPTERGRGQGYHIGDRVKKRGSD